MIQGSCGAHGALGGMGHLRGYWAGTAYLRGNRGPCRDVGHPRSMGHLLLHSFSQLQQLRVFEVLAHSTVTLLGD